MATFAGWARLFKGQSTQGAAFCQQAIPPHLVDAACAARGIDGGGASGRRGERCGRS